VSYGMWKVRKLAALGLIIFSLANSPIAQPLFLAQVNHSVLQHLRIAPRGSAIMASGWTPIRPGDRITWLCQPIRVVVNDRYVPPGGLQDVKQALIILSHATSVTWKYIGKTQKLPSANRVVDSPVLISWQHGGAKNSLGVSMINSEVSGTSGPYYSRDGNHWSSGVATFNVEKDYLYTPGFGKGRTRGALILHELGHVAGLGHVRDPNELMAEFSNFLNRPATYGPGDLAGLHALFPGCGAKRQGQSVDHKYSY
jgi:hypothetical protein